MKTRLKVLTSELYPRAISEFLKSRRADSITERLNDVYFRREAKVDSALHLAQLRSLKHDDLDKGDR